jgi:hypothetical protein
MSTKAVLEFCTVLLLAQWLLPGVDTVDKRSSQIYERWKQADTGGQYREANAAELRKAGTLFYRLLTLNNPSEVNSLLPLCRESGFEIFIISLPKEANSQGIVILHEKEDHKRGRGFFLFRPGSESPQPVLLQAPHCGDDRFTGTIAMKLFLEQPVRAAAFNTVKRKQVDLSHRYDTQFQVLNDEFARVFPTGGIIQLHGFAVGKRKSAAGKKAGIIISNGTRNPPPVLKEAAKCLEQKTNARVYLYGVNILELGATTNSQARSFAAMGFHGFIHVEMSLLWRQLLKENKESRETLFYCLGGK